MKKKKIDEEELIKKANEFSSPNERLNFMLKELGIKVPKPDPTKYVNSTPVNACPFGFKISWIAFKSNDRTKIIKFLNSKNKPEYQTNWEAGIDGAYDSFTFVSPLINGWLLAVSRSFSDISDEIVLSDISHFSIEVGEIQIFGSQRISSSGHFGRFVDGKLIRLLAVGDGNIYKDEGDFTSIELEIIEEYKRKYIDDLDHIKYMREKNFVFWLTDETNIVRIAEDWSINPLNFDSINNSELGTIF